MDLKRYNDIKDDYGGYGSWAIWNMNNQSDTEIIELNRELLHANVVIVGLNISDPLTSPWSNFRRGKHDRKLKYAFNYGPYRGAYMTDIIKNEVVKKTSEIERKIIRKEINIDEHLSVFKKEMKEIGADRGSLFVIFGKLANSIFSQHLKVEYPKYVPCRHYSHTGTTDVAWVEEVWTKLEEYSKRNQDLTENQKFFINNEMIHFLHHFRKLYKT